MYLIGYDIGSSSVKAALVDASTGKIVAQGHYPETEAPIKSLRAGWAEQRPDDWWSYLKAATAMIMRDARVDKDDIKAIGISYQMHGLVMLGADGKPLRDAIIWCDSRGVPFGEKAFADLGSDRCLGSLLNSPGNFTATKLQWVKQHEPETFDKISKVMLPGDYIAYRLTGRIVTNAEGLSEYMLWDFKNHSIADFMLDYFGYSRDIFPELLPSFGIQGTLTAEAASELGLSANTVVSYRAGDQCNNALSLGVMESGQVASTAGTSGVVYGINDTFDHDPLSRVNCFAHVNHTIESPRVGVMVCINGTGILNAWVKRNICPEGISYADMNRMAESVAPGSDGVTILPFGNGAERVLCNRDLGCRIKGVNFNMHNRAHIVRAAQEGIVFSFNYGIEVMQALGMSIKSIHAAHANMYLSPVFRETVAAVTGASVELYDTDGAVGAAIGAGIGVGIYATYRQGCASLRKIGTVEPAADRSPYIEAYARWKEWLQHELAQY